MIELLVEGMSCGHCVGAVTRAVQAVAPGAQVDVDLRSRRVRVDATSAAPATIAEAIVEAGYPATVQASAAPARVEQGPQPTRGCCGGGCGCNKPSADKGIAA